MLRVGDCPCDILKNRFNIVNLRYTSGKTAVHSDMIMWNVEDSVENAALQFASILYSVPQISMLIENLPPDHYEMLKFYISFWKEWKNVLLDGKLTATNPESEYSLVCSRLDDKEVYTAYNDTVIPVTVSKTVAVNATASKSLIIKNAKGKNYKVVNCMGRTVFEGVISSGLEELEVPTAGIIYIG
jgi:alpha-galactosidase